MNEYIDRVLQTALTSGIDYVLEKNPEFKVMAERLGFSRAAEDTPAAAGGQPPPPAAESSRQTKADEDDTVELKETSPGVWE